MALTVPYPQGATRLSIRVMLAFWVTPKPAPNSAMPATTAAGRSIRTRASMPAAVATTPGTSRTAGPCRSPNRPAHQRLVVATTA